MRLALSVLALLLALDGRQKQRLTHGGTYSRPSISRSGRKVIFERAGSVRVIATAGGSARRLVKGTQPTWGR